MGLFDFLKSEPQWQSTNPKQREKAFGKITDQTVLAEIAKSKYGIITRYSEYGVPNGENRDESWDDLRKRAINRLIDQDILADVFMNAKDF
ncbi:MAG: hypothetical protein FWG22_04780, partial [Prolixibacteraceae bacterium]|nr:hypothetical protein [Prolixibacteraceae bacterium]